MMRPTNPLLDTPQPDRETRKSIKVKLRTEVAAPLYGDVATVANGDEALHAPVYPLQFTKGLEHDDFGFVDPDDYAKWVEQVNVSDTTYTSGGFKALKTGAAKIKAPGVVFRGWESPRSGHAYDLEGPDTSEVGMAAAPRLGSAELVAEVAEVYAMALLRDCTFREIEDGSSKKNPAGNSPKDVIHALSKIKGFEFRGHAGETGIAISKETVFRGSTLGSYTGPYMSQFMLQGAKAVGEVGYGPQKISLDVVKFPEHRDYLVHWQHWLDVQNGADVGASQHVDQKQATTPITTPRDLASFVRIDALYQAYHLAALTMLDKGVDASSGFPSGGRGDNRASFATFGGPHLLALFAEVSSRALKAVRRQKYNFHRRGRPERVGAMLNLVENGEGHRLGTAEPGLVSMCDALGASGLLDMVEAHNKAQKPAAFAAWTNPGWMKKRNLLLPMAFVEGSPMHPAYGAGHATVAGACVTVLKAFFETATGTEPGKGLEPLSKIWEDKDLVDAGGASFDFAKKYPDARPLTINGELDKLAANVSIGRNMAGVHFYSDYFDSLRMGERIAMGILYEQLATYGEPVTMRFESFDGDRVVMSSEGPYGKKNGFPRKLDAQIYTRSGQTLSLKQWWTRHTGIA